ncbi:MAG: hypothetical protein ACRCYD_15145 [Plesiomonas sp.]
MSIEVLFPVGRLVSGHPMEARPVTDKDDRPVMDASGSPVTDRYIGVAIPKAGEQHWNQTEWGAKVWQAAQDPVNGYPNGEFNSPTFSWKIVDGDSQVPNKKGNKPCDQEGYAGHWVVHMSTRLAYGCFHVGRYDALQAIQNKGEIKRGDYCRVFCSVKGNKPSQSPGVYVNPQLFELTRAGIEIVSVGSGPAAADVFGATAAVMPSNAQVDTAVVPTTPPAAPAPVTPPAAPAPVTPPAAPAYDLVTPPVLEEKYTYSGMTKTLTEWCAMPGWSEALIKQHGTRA